MQMRLLHLVRLTAIRALRSFWIFPLQIVHFFPGQGRSPRPGAEGEATEAIRPSTPRCRAFLEPGRVPWRVDILVAVVAEEVLDTLTKCAARARPLRGKVDRHHLELTLSRRCWVTPDANVVEAAKVFEVHVPPLHRTQLEIAQDSTRFRGIAAGRRWGLRTARDR